MVAKLKGMPAAEWVKKSSQGPNKGIPRANLMISALGKIAILQRDGKEDIFADNQENRTKLQILQGYKNDNELTADGWPTGKQNQFKLRTKSQRLVSLNDVVKTAYFGGGTGEKDTNKMSATKLTAMFESLQCLYCAVMTKLPANAAKEKVTNTLLQAAFNSSRVKLNSTTIFKEVVSLDDSWHWSSYYVAQGLIKQGYISGAYSFHRDDAVMNSIYKSKARAFKNNEISNLNNDKWNPGDIWAIKDTKLVADIFKEKSLAESSVLSLNDEIQKAFFDKTIMGISLKKVIKPKLMKMTVINDKKFTAQQKPHTLEGIQLAGAKGLFSMQGGFLIIEGNQKIDVRPAAANGALNMEMILSTARGGKAGQSAQQQAASDFMNYTYPDNQEQLLEDRRITDNNEIEIKKFWKMIDTIQNSPLNIHRTSTTLKVDETIFRAELNNQEQNVIHAKKAVAHVFSKLADPKTTKKQRNDFVDYLVNYASSTLPESSVYLKVYQ